MKLKCFALSVLLLSQFSAYATIQKPTVNTAGWLTITNKSNTDIAYRVSGVFEGWVYGIKRGEIGTYALKGTDNYYSRFEVGVCKQMGVTGGTCSKFESLQPCLEPGYKLSEANFIEITSATSCALYDPNKPEPEEVPESTESSDPTDIDENTD